MPRWVVTFCIFLALGSSAEAKRVGLIIGNSAYKNAGELTNPKNDATDMSAAMKKVGFQIIDGFDLDKTNFDRKIRDFAAALSGAEIGLFFYAGHGLQVAGQNYLVPVDAELTTAAALEFEMVRLDVVQRIMENAAPTNILFLDACRNNPLSRGMRDERNVAVNIDLTRGNETLRFWTCDLTAEYVRLNSEYTT